jgi:hypothetical protein
MRTQPTTPPQKRPQPSPADPVALDLQRKLKRLLRYRTSTDALEQFLSSLNAVIVTALIKQALDRIEKENGAAAP